MKSKKKKKKENEKLKKKKKKEYLKEAWRKHVEKEERK